MMRWRHSYWLVALVATDVAVAADVAIARFFGGRFGRELCAGVLLAPSVVLTTAHCALSPQLTAVSVSSSSSSDSAATTERRKQRVELHPRFGVGHAFANNVALIFLDEVATGDEAQLRMAVLPANISASDQTQQTAASARSQFQELQVRPDDVAWASRLNFSQASCAGSPDFSGDASVWCSQQTAKHFKGSSASSSSGCASEKTLRGSPIVSSTLDQDDSERVVIVGLRLTEPCAELQAFVYIPSVLEFILPRMQPTPAESSSKSQQQNLLGFGFDATAVGKVSLGEPFSASISGSDDGVSASSSSSASGSSSSSLNGDIVILDDSLGSELDSDDSARAGNFVGGWAELPSLGEYSSFAALVVQNTTSEYGELQGCLGILIAPKYLVADGLCMAFVSEPQVIVSAGGGRNNTSTKSYRVANVVRHQDYDTALVIIELAQPIIEMTPLAISRSVPKQYQVTDETWELVAMDNLFASQRTDLGVVVKKSIVRLPPTSCSVLNYEAVPFFWCLALGSERDRQEVVGFSQGLILHDRKLVALPQCYSAICPGGLFHDTAFLAAKEDWIRNETQNTALWDHEPLNLANLSDDTISAEDDSLKPASLTFTTILGATSTGRELCTGVLIAPTFVLTSASCIGNTTLFHVRLGIDYRVGNNKTVEDTMSVRSVHLHPAFESSNATNDLALVELKGMSYFAPVQLAWDDKLLQPQPETSATSNTTSNSVGSMSGSNTNSSSSDDSDSLSFTEFETATLLVDAPEPPKYSWPLSVSRLDESILCASETFQAKSTNVSLSSSISVSSSGSGEALAEEVLQCSLLKPVSASATSSGSGLVAELAGGNALLGITSTACSSSTCLDETSSSTSAPSCYARIATQCSRDFINSVSLGHVWQGKPGGSKRIETMNAMVIPADEPGYTGSLMYDAMPADTQVGFVVGLRKDKSGQNFCGGSLIAPSYVLTAAHCVLGGEAAYVSVGSRASSGTETELIAIKKNKVIVHPMYGKQSSISYDVAIIELEVQAYPAPIKLDNALNFDASTEFTLFGYGANSAKSTSLSLVMRSVDLPFYDRPTCQQYYPELDISMLCAGGKPARDACTGDSGSPLVYYQNGNPVLVGVVSTGRNGCGTPGVPGIYGYVSSMQAFVNSYVAGTTWLDPTKVVGPLQTKLTKSSTQQSLTSPATSTNEMRTSLNETTGDSAHSAADAHQLSVVKLAPETPELLQDALMGYLLGGYTNIGGVWSRISAEIRNTTTSVMFYSSGDMTALLGTIAEHHAKPLYQRSSRFGKREDGSTQLLSACCHG